MQLRTLCETFAHCPVVVLAPRSAHESVPVEVHRDLHWLPPTVDEVPWRTIVDRWAAMSEECQQPAAAASAVIIGGTAMLRGLRVQELRAQGFRVVVSESVPEAVATGVVPDVVAVMGDGLGGSTGAVQPETVGFACGVCTLWFC